MQAELILTIAAVITALGVIAGLIYSVYKVAKRIGDALGVDEHGRTIADRLDRVEHQLWENGGSSLADRVNNIESHVIKTSAEMELIKDLTIGLQTAMLHPVPVERPVAVQRASRKKSS